MSLTNYATFVAALIFVLALILMVAWLMRRFGLGTAMMPMAGRQRRLAIVDMLALDPRRRLILVRRDDVEHLLLIGQDSAVVVEKGIRPSFSAALSGDRPDPENGE
jgi:flagellar protein FliO/FliZ